MNPRNPDDETRYIGPTSGGSGGGYGNPGDQGRPRQYFPGEHDPNFRYDPAYEQPYEEPYAPSSVAPAPAKKSGGALPMLLGILFGLIANRKKDSQTLFPWGPAITAAAIVTLLAGQPLLEAYMALL